jgi:hypothetical protein
MKTEEPKPKPDQKHPSDSGDRVGTEVYLAFESSTPPPPEMSDEVKVVENDDSGKKGQSTEEKRKSPGKSSEYADIQYCCYDSDEELSDNDEQYGYVTESIQPNLFREPSQIIYLMQGSLIIEQAQNS